MSPVKNAVFGDWAWQPSFVPTPKRSKISKQMQDLQGLGGNRSIADFERKCFGCKSSFEASYGHIVAYSTQRELLGNQVIAGRAEFFCWFFRLHLYRPLLLERTGSRNARTLAWHIGGDPFSLAFCHGFGSLQVWAFFWLVILHNVNQQIEGFSRSTQHSFSLPCESIQRKGRKWRGAVVLETVTDTETPTAVICVVLSCLPDATDRYSRIRNHLRQIFKAGLERACEVFADRSLIAEIICGDCAPMERSGKTACKCIVSNRLFGAWMYIMGRESPRRAGKGARDNGKISQREEIPLLMKLVCGALFLECSLQVYFQ